MQQPFIKLSENEFGDVQLRYIDSNFDTLAKDFQTIALAKCDLLNVSDMILDYCSEEGITNE